MTPQKSDASVAKVALNLEVHIIPVSDVGAAPGTAAAALVVSDIKAAHAELVSRGIEASPMWHGAPFPLEARLPGPRPQRTSYGSFFAFADPDGNAWLVQEVTTRRPGRD